MSNKTMGVCEARTTKLMDSTDEMINTFVKEYFDISTFTNVGDEDNKLMEMIIRCLTLYDDAKSLIKELSKEVDWSHDKINEIISQNDQIIRSIEALRRETKES